MSEKPTIKHWWIEADDYRRKARKLDTAIFISTAVCVGLALYILMGVL